MALNLESLSVQLTLDAAKYKTGLAEAQTKLDGFQTKLNDVSAKATAIGKNLSLKVTAPLIGIGTGAVMAASNVEEAWDKVSVVFGDSASAVQSWSATSATSMGISQAAALDMAGTLGILLTGMGFTTEEAGNVSMEMVQLAGDLGSLNNVPTPQALNAIRSALIGEYEPLRQFAAGVSAATVEEKALEMGLWDGEGALDANAKAQATLALVTENTASAHGNFALTSDGAANSMRIAQAQMANAAATLGAQLLPMVTAAAQFVANLAERFQGLSDGTQTAIVAVAAIAAAIGPLLMVFGMMASGLSSLIGLMGPLAAGIRLVSAAMMANPIGIAILAIVAAIALLYVAYKTNFLGFRDGVNAAISAVTAKFNEFKPQIMAVKDALVNAFNAAWPIVQGALNRIRETVQQVIGAITQIFQGWIQTIQGIMQVIKGVLTGDWSLIKEGVVNIVTGLKEQALGVFALWKAGIDLIMDALKAAIPAAWQFIKDNAGRIVDGMKDTITSTVNSLKDTVTSTFTDLKGSVVSRVNELQDSVTGSIDRLRDTVSNTVSDLKDKAVSTFNDLKDKATAAVSGMKDSIISTGQELLSGASAQLQALKDNIVTRITEAKDSAVSRVTEMKDSIIAKGQELLAGAKAQFEILKTAIVGKFTEAKESAVETVSGLVSDVVSLFTGLPGQITEALGDLGGLLIQAGKDLLGGLISGIEAMMGPLEDMLGKIGGLLDKLPGSPLRPATKVAFEKAQKAGLAYGEGLAAGVDAAQSMVGRELRGITGEIDSADFGGYRGGDTYVDNRTFNILKSEELMRIIRDSEDGGNFARGYGASLGLVGGRP